MYKELSDKLWEVAEPLLLPFRRTRPGGSEPIPFRNILNGIFYLLRTGCQWDMIPRHYGSKSTIHEHFQRWVRGCVFDTLFRMSAEEYEEIRGIGWEWQAMDGGMVQAPTRQAGGTAAKTEGLGRNPTDRGRQGTKVHLLVDMKGIPLGMEIIGANVHDSRLVTSTLETIVIERPLVTRESPQNLCMDKGYDYKRVKEEVISNHYEPHIRRIGEKKSESSGERLPARRFVVERTIAWLKGFRALRTRYFCKGTNYLGMLRFAASLIIFRAMYPDNIWA